MKIRLSRSGGLVGKKMIAEIDFDLSNEEWKELSTAIQIGNAGAAKRKKDAFSYSLQIKGDERTLVNINPNLVPEKYQNVFQQLFDALKPDDK